ncbi:MAG: helix-turn-helix domain-containing protein [Pseudonocardiaceae bacterium]
MTTVSTATTPDLGARIRRYRENAGLSREQAAVHSGRSMAAVRDWELNQRKPSRLQLVRLAKLYGVTLTELTGDNEECR